MELENELLGECSVEEIKRGYREDSEGYSCLICGQRFEKGEIFSSNGRLYEAHKAVKVHISEVHGSVREYLLKSKAQNMGISELQLQLLNFFASGISDKEIAEKLQVSGSTIRNHRYKLRERERQSKLFLALMEGLQDKGLKSSLAEKNANNMEEKEVSDKEKRRILERYMTEDGRLKSYPSFERNRCIILRDVLTHFNVEKQYSEEEIKEILEAVFEDYKLLRDELIVHNYLGRTSKGAVYWVRKQEMD